MKCNAPTVAFRRPGINPATGKHYSPVSFRQFSRIFQGTNLSRCEQERAIVDYYRSCPAGLEPVLLPCKRCMLCCRNYKRGWAYRLVCEARMAPESMYLTLTVDPEHLAEVFPGGSLRHEPFQKFMKRLRIKLARGYDYSYVPPFTSSSLLGSLPRIMQRRHYQRKLIRYYMCGEYGEQSMRPHYHCCVFGARFPDAFFAKKVGGEAYYTSPTLLELWPYGRMSLFSDVTARSAAYVAGYVEKKLERDQEAFKALGMMPEYVRMSNGLGLDYFDEYCDQLYPEVQGDVLDWCRLSDLPVAPPRYFDEKLLLRDPAKYDRLFASRERRRLERQRIMPVDEELNEAGRKNAVMLARRHVREIGS